jgi:hypothetical protein
MLHYYLGHLSVDRIWSLICHNSIKGIELINEGSSFSCSSCDHTKLTRKTIRLEREVLPAAAFRDEIHSDVWGPSLVTSIGGRKYYVTFTDDYSQYMWAQTLKKKSNILGAYCAFTAWALTQFHVVIH